MATAVARFKLRALGFHIGMVMVVSGLARNNSSGNPAVSRPKTR